MRVSANAGLVIGGVALLATAGLYYQYRKVKQQIADTHQAGREAIRPVTDAVWNIWTFVRGEPVYPESPQDGFYLNEKYVKNGVIDPNWRRSIELMHEGNAQLFNLITDEHGSLKIEYRHLINSEVSYATTKQ